MAIKFSQFVVRTNSSDLSHIVGYNGVDNIQITPTNFLNSALTGTAGQVLFYDTTGIAGDNDLYWDNTNKRLGIGTTSPQKTLDVANGDIRLDNSKGIMFATLDGNIGRVKIIGDESGDFIQMNVDNSNNHLLRLDTTGVGIGTNNPSEKLEVAGNIKVGDSQQFIAGGGNDLQIQHNSTDSFIENNTGNLFISNFANDKDIRFATDDGSGGVATYFQLDGSAELNRFAKNVMWNDNVVAYFGGSFDLQIKHDGTNSEISNLTGNLNIKSTSTDGDITFYADDGSGGVTEYFRVDGGSENVLFSKLIKMSDNVEIRLGDGNDLKLNHDGTDSFIRQTGSGNLYIKQEVDDKDIVFQCDDGSGGVTTYMKLDGSQKYVNLKDSITLTLGAGNDLRLLHNGSDSRIENYTGNLTIQQRADDSDIVFQCDDGSGGLTDYFRLDGSAERTLFSKNILFTNNTTALFGNDGDLSISHNGTDSVIDNFDGDLYITNKADDKDIIFRSDDGSGGFTPYITLDGSQGFTTAQKNIRFDDGAAAQFGNDADLRLYHNGTNSNIENFTGTLQIIQHLDDADISFQCDNGSGSLTEYFRLDGSSVQTIAEKDFRFIDNAKVIVGTGSDLQIYHDGTNSYIADTSGAGGLRINTNQLRVNSANGNEVMILANENGEVSLYHNNVKKLDTRTTGVRITGVSEYADNTAAIAGGLTTGDVYRTGDLLKIVH